MENPFVAIERERESELYEYEWYGYKDQGSRSRNTRTRERQSCRIGYGIGQSCGKHIRRAGGVKTKSTSFPLQTPSLTFKSRKGQGNAKEKVEVEGNAR